jgi:hypothetical protein
MTNRQLTRIDPSYLHGIRADMTGQLCVQGPDDRGRDRRRRRLPSRAEPDRRASAVAPSDAPQRPRAGRLIDEGEGESVRLSLRMALSRRSLWRLGGETLQMLPELRVRERRAAAQGVCLGAGEERAFGGGPPAVEAGQRG